MPAYFDQAQDLISFLAGGFTWPLQPIMSNLWLFGGLVKLILSSKPLTATLVRTTTALTLFKSGYKDNVLPSTAVALVNHRIHPRDSVAKVGRKRRERRQGR